MFFTLPWFDHCLITDILNEIKSHMGNCRRPVQTTLCFHLFYDMLQHLFFILIQFQRLENQRIPFCQLRCCKTNRDLCCLCMIFDQMHDRMQTSMYRTTVFVDITVVNLSWPLLIFCHMQRMSYQFIDTFVLRRRDGNDRNPQHLFHLVDQNRSAVFPYLIHHIQGKHHRNIQLHQLHGQIQIPLNIGSIHNVDDSFRMFIQHKISCNDLLTGIWGHGIDSRKIGHQCVFFSPDSSIFSVHRYSRKVTHMLTGSGQLIKQCGFSTVLIPRKCKCQHLCIRQRMFRFLLMIFTTLSKSRMGDYCSFFFFRFYLSGIPYIFNLNFLRICKTQCQFITVNPQFHRISHGSVLYYCYLSLWNQSHIQKMLTQRPFSAYRANRCCLSYR